MRSTTILNEFGDTTIAWDEESDAMVREVIQKKMNEGVSFFIVKPRFGGLLSPKKVKLKSTKEITKDRALSVKVEDFAKLMATGAISAIRSPSDSQVETIGRASTAAEAARTHTVAIRPMQGG